MFSFYYFTILPTLLTHYHLCKTPATLYVLQASWRKKLCLKYLCSHHRRYYIPRKHSDTYCLLIVNKNKQLLEAFHYHLELKSFSTFHYENFQTYRKDNVVQSSIYLPFKIQLLTLIKIWGFFFIQKSLKQNVSNI